MTAPELPPDTDSSPPQPADTHEDARTGYEAAVALWTYEGSLFWARFDAMLVANSIIIGVQAVLLSSQRPSVAAIILLCVAGLVLCALWFLGSGRGFSYYTYWILSARELEERHFAPTVTTVSRGASFASGQPVTLHVNGMPFIHQLGRLDRVPIKRIAFLVIFLFAILYLAVPFFTLCIHR